MEMTTYPISASIEMPTAPGRFWAIPALGLFVRSIFLIPHLIILYILAIWISILQLGVWVPVLFGGEYPDFALRQISGYLRWSARLWAYLMGLTDAYPPFGMQGGETYPIDVHVPSPQHCGRFWAIPVVGYAVKIVILIPHLIIVSVLLAVVQLAALVIWIPVLFTGKYPSWGYQLNSGYIQWTTRVTGYLYGLTDKYPPFSMA